ncbi:MAG: hypothetical protein ABIH46_01380 [Chloroflexota bacterium]
MGKPKGLDKDDVLVREVRYYQLVRAPTLRQYIHRRFVKSVMESLKVGPGVGIDMDTGRPAPLTAIEAKARIKGSKAENLMREHPEWIEDYYKEYPEVER